jgi:hypothetical protein
MLCNPIHLCVWMDVYGITLLLAPPSPILTNSIFSIKLRRHSPIMLFGTLVAANCVLGLARRRVCVELCSRSHNVEEIPSITGDDGQSRTSSPSSRLDLRPSPIAGQQQPALQRECSESRGLSGESLTPEMTARSAAQPAASPAQPSVHASQRSASGARPSLSAAQPSLSPALSFSWTSSGSVSGGAGSGNSSAWEELPEVEWIPGAAPAALGARAPSPTEAEWVRVAAGSSRVLAASTLASLCNDDSAGSTSSGEMVAAPPLSSTGASPLASSQAFAMPSGTHSSRGILQSHRGLQPGGGAHQGEPAGPAGAELTVEVGGEHAVRAGSDGASARGPGAGGAAFASAAADAPAWVYGSPPGASEQRAPDATREYLDRLLWGDQ